MKEIQLTKGYVTLVDDEDYESLACFSWAAVAVRKKYGKVRIYARRFAGGKPKQYVSMHRQILGLQAGDGLEGDHKNRNTLDNRRTNLRVSTRTLNSCNTPLRKNKTGFRGVDAKGGIYRATIKVNQRTRHLGQFKTPELAARAYDEAARNHFGEFAVTNFESP